MGLSLFIQSCRGIQRNPGASTLPALMRHAVWHGVRRMARLPLTIPLTAKSQLVIEKRQELNGCVALAWSQRLYDYHNMSLIRHLASEGYVSTCFDIGANIGVYSLLMSELEGVTVHAFEPHPATYATLQRMLEKNGRKNVRAWQIALSDAGGLISFTNEDFSPVNKAVPSGQTAENMIQVSCETGAAFCERVCVYPDLLKIDTEGLETNVLRGFGSHLSSVKLVFAEMNSTPAEMSEVLPERLFDGPFYAEMRQLTLQRERHNHEDAIYVNRRFMTELSKLGITIET